MSLAATNDAVCIAWVSVLQSDGSTSGAWTGDIGKACGQSWYHSNQQAGKLKNGTAYTPACTWFDGDHTNGIVNAGLKFRIYAYGEGAEETVKADKACGASIFGNSTGPISGESLKLRCTLWS